MDEYVKTLRLKLATEFDKNKLNDVKNEFKDLEAAKLGIFDEKELKEAEKAFEDFKKKEFEIEHLKEAISEIKMFDKDNAHLKELEASLEKLEEKKEDINNEDEMEEKGTFGSGFKEAFNEWKEDTFSMSNVSREAFALMRRSISNFASKALDSIKNFVTDAIEYIKSMASWNISESNKYNSEAVNIYLETGLQGSQAYAMKAALESQNFSSMEEFYEAMPFMTKQQLEYMKENAEIAEKDYDNSVSTSMKFQEFSKEYDIFKKELQSELIDFFMQNSDTIKAFLDVGIKAMEIAVKFFGWIFDKFSTGQDRTDAQKKQTTADILGVQSSTLVSNNNSRNVNVSNTFNGVAKTDQSWLANTGQMTYLQIIQALK